MKKKFFLTLKFKMYIRILNNGLDPGTIPGYIAKESGVLQFKVLTVPAGPALY
jgi:hypothetical protein